MIIAVDFDGTIVTDCFPEIGEENAGIIEFLTIRQAAGDQLILWTCREDSKIPGTRAYLFEALTFCRSRGLIFDAVNENVKDNPHAHLGDSRKIFADLYIDDKAIAHNLLSEMFYYRSEDTR
jgi:hypothetical protein